VTNPILFENAIAMYEEQQEIQQEARRKEQEKRLDIMCQTVNELLMRPINFNDYMNGKPVYMDVANNWLLDRKGTPEEMETVAIIYRRAGWDAFAETELTPIFLYGFRKRSRLRTVLKFYRPVPK
jgi:hypothetical protein